MEGHDKEQSASLLQNELKCEGFGDDVKIPLASKPSQLPGTYVPSESSLLKQH